FGPRYRAEGIERHPGQGNGARAARMKPAWIGARQSYSAARDSRIYPPATADRRAAHVRIVSWDDSFGGLRVQLPVTLPTKALSSMTFLYSVRLEMLSHICLNWLGSVNSCARLNAANARSC